MIMMSVVKKNKEWEEDEEMLGWVTIWGEEGGDRTSPNRQKHLNKQRKEGRQELYGYLGEECSRWRA